MRQKRYLSWLLTLCLLLGMFSFPAYAEGNTTTISGDGTAEKTGTMTVTLVIPKKTPAATDLTYTAPSDLVYSGSNKAATVAAKDGVTGMGEITVKYYSDAARSTEVTETKNVGTYYVGATVAEGDQYAASTAVLYGDGWTFEITKSTPSAPAAPTKASATKNSITLNAVSGCEYSKDGANWQSGTEFTGLLPGTEYTFYQRVKATANTNASAASSAKFSTEADTYAMTITLVIKPAQTITASDVTATYGDTDKSVSASVTEPTTGGGAITYAVKDGSGDYISVNESTGALTIKAVPPTDGKAYVIVTAAETDDYAEATKEVVVTISKATVTVAAENQSIYVNGTVPDLSAPVLDTHYTVTGLVGEDALTTAPVLAYQKDGSAATPDNTTAGTYDIVASGASASDNYTITYANGTLTISDKGTQTITADDVTVTYGDTDKKVSASVTDPTEGGGAISYAVKEGSGDYIDVDATTGALTIKKVPADGKAYVTVTAAETATYAQATKDVTVTINKANSTVTKAPEAKTLTYNGQAQALVTAGEATGGEMQYALGTATEATEQYTTSIPAKTDAGTYYVWYKVVGDENHNDTEPACVEVTINKANITPTVSLEGWTYGQEANAPSVSGNTGNGAVTYTYATKGSDNFSATVPTNAGNYTVKATIAATANYNGTTATADFTIAKADPTYTAPTGVTATYGDTLADIALPTGWAWADGTQSVGNVGTNTFKANFTPTDTNNYNTVSNVNVSVTVGKANPTYTVPTGLTATYGQALANVTLPTGWSWVNGSASVGNVGTNSFKANFTPADTANYNTVSDVNVSVTVGKANPTYTVPTGLTATYGDTLSGVTLPTGWAWVDSTQSVGNVGTNTFKATFTPTDTTNYNTISDIEVKVTVSKAAGKEAVISTDTMSYTSDSIYIEGVAGQEYVIVPKGTAVTDADWNTSVKPDPERDNWVFFENLKEATEYEIYARTAETETAFASDAVKANVYTTLSSIGYLYDSTLVGASITVEPEPNVEGLTYKWYQDEVTEDGEGIIHHNLTEIPGATGSTYTFRAEDAGKHIAVKIFAGDSEVGDVATDAPVALTAKVIFESNGGSDVETLTDAAYQSKIKAPADPTREGFAFDGWYWDEEFETPFDFEKDVITWTETTLYAKWTPNDYKITSVTGLTGANNKQWTKGGKDAVVITVKVSGEDNSFDRFTGVKLDGKELVKDVDYTVEKGSTVVTLKPETLEKLSVGEHTVTVLFDNGEVNTTLTVLAANSQDATSPQTGDNSHMGLWIALMMFSLCGIAATLLYGRKKRVFGR